MLLRFSYLNGLIDISITYRYRKIHRSCRIHNFRQKNTRIHVQTHTHAHTRSSSSSHSERSSRAVEENANKNCVYVSGNTKQQTQRMVCFFGIDLKPQTQ